MYRPPVVGVAGQCCAGKDKVAAILIDRGYDSVNVDEIGHRALEEMRDRVQDEFGSEVLKEDNSIDRGSLGAIVFADPNRMRALEAIVHPWMREQVRLEVERFRARAGSVNYESGANHESTAPGLVINAALLFTMHLDQFCDHIIWVHAPLILRVYRGLLRDRRGLRFLFNRMRSQRRIVSQEQLSRADIIRVRNASTPESLEHALRRVPELGLN